MENQGEVSGARRISMFAASLEMQKLSMEVVAGTVGTALGTFLTYPLDTLKILRQSQPTVSPYSSLLRSIYRQNGVPGFFHGVTVPVVTYTALNATAIAVYKYIQKSLDPTMTNHHVMLVASVVSGFAQLVPGVPGEVLKIHMQVEAQQAHRDQLSIVQCMRQIYHREGVRGFYKGLLAQTYRDLPANVSYFLTYDLTHRHLRERGGYSLLTCAFWSGALCGIISWVVTTPLDVMKTLVQSGQCNSFMEAVRRVSQGRQGIGQQYFKGFTMILTKAFLGNSITFVGYEVVVHGLDLRAYY